MVSPSLPQVCGAAAGSGVESSVGPVLEEQSPELLRGMDHGGTQASTALPRRALGRGHGWGEGK